MTRTLATRIARRFVKDIRSGEKFDPVARLFILVQTMSDDRIGRWVEDADFYPLTIGNISEVVYRITH